MLRDNDKINEEFSGRILNYLRMRYDAGDSLEGIARWWLELESVEQSVDEVAQALESLVRKGLLKRINRIGTSIYKVNK